MTKSEKKEYHRSYNIKRYRDVRKQYIAFLGGRCNVCGSKKKLQFDHKNKEEKSFNITRHITYPKSYVMNELKKCQLLCLKCHTQNSGGWYARNSFCISVL
jgi:5-methylcytosine-specific restriction endonuclease McrA